MRVDSKYSNMESNVMEESEYAESDEEGDESKRCDKCSVICGLLLLLWCIAVGWSIYVVVPVVHLILEASKLTPEHDFVEGRCLILDVQHGSLGECSQYCTNVGTSVVHCVPYCGCEDVYSYTFKDAEGSKLTSSKEVKFTWSGRQQCDEDLLGRLTGDADCDRACKEQVEKCSVDVNAHRTCTEKASAYKIGNNVTCWKPRFAETISTTVGLDDVRAYKCANEKCVKIFDPAQDIEKLQLGHWNSPKNVFAIMILTIIVVCPCLLVAMALPRALADKCCK